MIYHAVNNRCLVDFDQLDLPISTLEAISILESQGFRREPSDITLLARSLVGSSVYRRGARLREAPASLDCSSLTKWVYGQIGVWLPRRAIQQRDHGVLVEISDLRPGDLVFASGWIDRYITNPNDGVGHVGISVGDGKIVHAANERAGIIESPTECFIRDSKFRGVRRIADLECSVILNLPEEREIETSNDVKWIVLQNLPRNS